MSIPVLTTGLTPAYVANIVSALEGLGGAWFDNNPLAAEYIYPENWSRWDWVQFGGATPLPSPLQATTPPAPGLHGYISPPLTLLAKIDLGEYEVFLDRKPSSGKPATNTSLYVKQSEIKIRLLIPTPLDLLLAVSLLKYAAAIFPADAVTASAKVIPVFHPGLRLYKRTSLILARMGYPQPSRHGEPGYVESVWIPQDAIKPGQNQVGSFGAVGDNSLGNPNPPKSTAPAATPPPVPPPDV